MSIEDAVTWARNQGARITAEHLEMLAAAYFQKTDIPPEDAVLVSEVRGYTMVWYFVRRDQLGDLGRHYGG